VAPNVGVEAYEAFWKQYVETVRRRQPAWRGIGTATSENHVYQSCSVPNCRIGAAFKHDGHIAHELVVMSPDADWNLKAFHGLSDRRKEVELAYGRHLTWDERPTRKRCLIGDYAIGTVANTWATDMYVEWFIDCGVRLRRVLDEFGGVIVERGTAS
jgi:Domain of unknown function (DUF4268)